jgi:amidophosphoribosyltransferase
VVDDSIVRGNTSRKLVQLLRDAGATEVHMRLTSPPVVWPCFYGIDTDSQDQLIAATHPVEEIAEFIDADSVAYLPLDDLIASTGRPAEEFCTACFSGEYPIEVPDPVRRGKLHLEQDA